MQNKLLFLSEDFKLPYNFYNVNNFIINREYYFYNLRKKYLKTTFKILQYDGNNSKLLKYFLLEDI